MPLRDALKVAPPETLRAMIYRDPWMFMAAFSLYAALSAVTMLASRDLMDASPLYVLLRDTWLEESQVGSVMMADAVALLWTLFDKRLAVRLPIAFVSGAVWFVWGGVMLISGLAAHLVSGVAIWNICGGLGCYLAVIQWINREELE
ncbi:hypothetical protein [Roseomonas elaeocarpi]|uniref:Uncharacterized protein n=1 Tax=Roseomonas elaeocarpi TaxID=907779 RepID=A0ABV6JU95_9PROT